MDTNDIEECPPLERVSQALEMRSSPTHIFFGRSNSACFQTSSIVMGRRLSEYPILDFLIFFNLQAVPKCVPWYLFVFKIITF